MLSLVISVMARSRKPGPRRRRSLRGQPGISCVGAAGLQENLAEGRLPAVRECRNAERGLDPLTRMAGQAEHPVDLRDGHCLWPGRDPHDRIARLNSALAQHPEVKARPVVRDQEPRRHPRVVHSDANPVTVTRAGRHLEESLANLKAVTDAHLVVRQAADGEVLAELPVLEVVAASACQYS